MRVTRIHLLFVLAVLAGGMAACATRPGERPWWKFWSRDGRSSPFSVEIPAPPEVVMPNVASRELEPPKPGASVADPADGKRGPAAVIQPALKTVYFDYDSAELTDATQETLRENAEWLREHSQVEVQAQGHCDERGTAEYNFALGQRRADAVKNFLVRLSVSADRIHTISYGRERPAVAESNEEAWRLNRRVEFHAY